MIFAWRRTVLRRRVLLTTRTGRTFAGVLWARRGPLLVLVDVTTNVDGRTVPVDGSVVVERTNVDFVQVLPGEGVS